MPAGPVEVTSQWSTAGEMRLHVRNAGPPAPGAPVVVLVHGLVASSRTFVPTLGHVGRWARALAPDLPGFGRSPAAGGSLAVGESAEVLHQWMVEARVQGATVVGHSLGASVAAHLAARHPESVSRIVLVSPAFDRRSRRPLRPVLRWVRNAPHETLRAHAVLARDLVDCGVPRALRTFRHGLADRLEDQVVRLRAPTLVVRGDRDRVSPQHWVEELVALVPGAELAVIPGAGHVLGYTEPAALDGLIVDFVGRRAGF